MLHQLTVIVTFVADVTVVIRGPSTIHPPKDADGFTVRTLSLVVSRTPGLIVAVKSPQVAGLIAVPDHVRFWLISFRICMPPTVFALATVASVVAIVFVALPTAALSRFAVESYAIEPLAIGAAP